jgi:hypothetical protein
MLLCIADRFFLNGAGPKGPGSFIPAVGELLQEGPENKRKLQTGYQILQRTP